MSEIEGIPFTAPTVRTFVTKTTLESWPIAVWLFTFLPILLVYLKVASNSISEDTIPSWFIQWHSIAVVIVIFTPVLYLSLRAAKKGRRAVIEEYGSSSEELQGRTNQSETVTVTFIANYEIDPEKVDLRYNDIRKQLRGAVIPGTDRPQEVLGVDDDALELQRKRIWEAKHGSE